MTMRLQQRLDKLEARTGGQDFDIAAALNDGGAAAMRWHQLSPQERLREARASVAATEEPAPHAKAGMRDVWRMLVAGERRFVAGLERDVATANTASPERHA